MGEIDITKLSDEQRRLIFEQEKKKEKEAEEKRREEREAYKDTVSDLIGEAIEKIKNTSDKLSETKMWIFKQFETAIDLKTGIYGVKGNQKSYTFTNKDSSARVVIGYETGEDFDDTSSVGVAMIDEWLDAQLKEGRNPMLVGVVRQALSRNHKGELDAGKIRTLRKLAIQYNEQKLIEAIDIIQDASKEAFSAYFVRAYEKNGVGAWSPIPLHIRAADFPEGFEVKF